MRGVKPLSRDPEPPLPKARPAKLRSEHEAESARFEVFEAGERLAGIAPGIDRAHLRRLREGKVAIDRRIDLHGMTADSARQAVRAALADLLREGKRCLLVVHGRGSHSAQEPVLKRSLAGWLGESPHGTEVIAYTSATPERGGAGATLVLLRRPKSRSRRS